MFKVNLVSITKPLVIGASGRELTPEQLIVYIARVSNPNNQLNLDTGPKLIKFMVDEGHVSPFEQVDFTVEITTSRAIAQQLLRHWSFSFQEFSQRYAEAQNHIVYPARRQDKKNRQNSMDDMTLEDREWFDAAQMQVWEASHILYKEALTKGIAREQARFLLPLSTQTTLYMKGNVRDWIFYLKLRSANGTQKEHADIANKIRREVFVPNFPVISEALGWSNKE
jgi:thymidylate synthase (FAD)